MLCFVTILGAAVLGTCISTASTRLEQAQLCEVSLLQADVVIKSQRALAEEELATATVPHAKQHDLCSMPAHAVHDAASDAAVEWVATDATAPPTDVAAETALWGDLARPEVATQAPEESTDTRPMFACILEILIVLVVLDGFRRWQLTAKARRDGPAEGDIAAKGGWEGLMQAALGGDTSRCHRLLRDKRIAVANVDAWGCTVLHAAAKGGSVPVVQRVLELGAGVHERDAWDETPLHLAARVGHVEVCEVLLAFGAQINAVNAQDWTPLVVAADAGHQNVCKLLLARGAGVASLPDSELPSLLSTLLVCDILDNIDKPDAEQGDGNVEPFPMSAWY